MVRLFKIAHVVNNLGGCLATEYDEGGAVMELSEREIGQAALPKSNPTAPC